MRHLPVVEAGRLVGVWTATGDGPLLLLGPERVHETHPDVDAAEAMEALLADAEVVFVWDAGVPAGILTRSDVLAMVRAALGRGIGRRHPRPCVLRLAGPAGAGKTTLIVRTLPLLGRIDTAVVQANAAEAGDAGALAGARAVDDPHAHWRAGLTRATDRLADAQLILLEDRDGPVELSHGIGEDAQVAVVPSPTSTRSPTRRSATRRRSSSRAWTRSPRTCRRGSTRCARASRYPRLPGRRGHDDRGLDAWGALGDGGDRLRPLQAGGGASRESPGERPAEVADAGGDDDVSLGPGADPPAPRPGPHASATSPTRRGNSRAGAASSRRASTAPSPASGAPVTRPSSTTRPRSRPPRGGQEADHLAGLPAGAAAAVRRRPRARLPPRRAPAGQRARPLPPPGRVPRVARAPRPGHGEDHPRRPHMRGARVLGVPLAGRARRAAVALPEAREPAGDHGAAHARGRLQPGQRVEHGAGGDAPRTRRTPSGRRSSWPPTRRCCAGAATACSPTPMS